MSPSHPAHQSAPFRTARPVLVLAGILGLSLLSCGREITGPENGVRPRIASGLSFVAEFPGAFASVEAGAGSVVAFNRVRVIFRRADGSVALDRIVLFPDGEDEIAQDFSITLSSSAPAAGEPLDLYLRYINAGGDTVFAGGPVAVIAAPSAAGGPPPNPAPVPLTYTGPGSSAVSIRILPDTITVTAGDPFEFTAEARNAQEAIVADAPIIFSVLDPTHAALVTGDSGAGISTPVRGTARVRVALAAGGAADTAYLVVQPRPASLEIHGGNAQTGDILFALSDSIEIGVLATDGQPMTGVAVAASVTLGGGSVSPDTALTGAGGIARFAWTLGSVVGAQSASFSSEGLTPREVTATGVDNGAIVATTVTPALDTLVSIGETTTLTAMSNDAALNAFAGTYTWSSDAPATATVNPAGVVTAVAPGAAWIIATETGGTRDSARIVVHQQLASVIVTPGARTLYLGASHDFTANAVDGLGVPLATQPTFAWTVESSAIASVDSTGFVTALGIGSTQIRAESFGVQGVATLTVETAITRVAVIRDSASFVTADTFTIEALARTRSYRAVAYDTLDAAMPGVTFIWESSNPSVASFDSTGTATARIVATANGITAVRATAQGVMGAASLTVQQRLAAIELSPSAAAISATGVTLITARGLDPDGTHLPTLAGVTFASNNLPVATVNASTGLVTGVANGTALITATKDTITSDTTVITVGGAVPAVISFGRDTLSIGRSASLSIPIYLSRPDTVPVNVVLAVADTFAHFSQASVNIPAGQTSINATLNGHSAGNTLIFATNGGANGYAGDTASLRVQAVVKFTSTSYALVATNEVATQLLLTDPAPAGGTYVTYAYGTPGRVSVSPDPAFIPQGQLAANVVITALAGGGSTVMPVATGVNGTASTVTTYPATLDINQTLARMGAGQYRTDTYVQTPTTLTQALGIGLAIDDTTIATAVPSVVINAGTYYVYFNLVGKSPGTTYLRASAPGFTGDSTAIVITTPKIDVATAAARTTTAAPAGITVYARDSVNTAHARSTPLVVSLSSSDTTIIKVLTPTATIAAGSSSNGSGQLTSGGEIGAAYLIATAPGHGRDSVLVTVNGPKLSWSFTTTRVGTDQRVQNLYVQIPDNTPTARTVHIQRSDTTGALIQIPDSVVIPAGTYYTYLDVDGLAPGSVTLIASTPGHEPDTATFIVTSPRLVQGGGGTYDAYRPPLGITTTVVDSLGSAHPRTSPLVVSYVSTDTTVVTVSPSATIAAGAQSTNTALVTFTYNGTGDSTAQVIVTAPGHVADTISYTVRTPKLQLSWTTYRIGRRQYTSNTTFYVHVPNNVNDTLPVTLTQSNGAIDSLSTLTPNIPAGTYFTYFGLSALGFGTDTIIASAPGYLPDTAFVVVTSTRLVVGNLPTPRTTTTPPTAFSISLADSVGTSHPSMDTVVVFVEATNPGVLQPVATSYRILPGQQNTNGSAAFVGVGTGQLIVSDSLGNGYASDTTNVVTVTGPSLSLTNNSPKLGMRQNNGASGAYVQVPNNIAGSPLVVYLASSDPAVATVPDSVIIPVGTYYAYFQIAAHDVVGTIQISANAGGYAPASVNQQVTAPRFVVAAPTSVRVTQNPPTITVSAADADGTVHYTNEPVVVTLASTSAAVGIVDSATVTIAAGAQNNNTARFVPVAPGTVNIEASDARVESYKYNTGTDVISVTVPNLTSWTSPLSLAVGQYSDEVLYLPDTRTASPLPVTLDHATAATATADTITVNVGQSNRTHRVTGAALGVDTITFSAPGHNPASSPVVVALGRVDGLGGWPTTLNSDSVQVTLYPKSANGTQRRHTVATTFTLAVDANLQFVSGGAASVPITSVVVPADAYSVSFWLKRVSAGTANVSISAANYQTYTSAITVNP